ncbi:MAG: hypothetical protein AAF985_24485, partial [Bacteroidota bacterium]
GYRPTVLPKADVATRLAWMQAMIGEEPQYREGQLQSMYQTLKIFRHPHDVCVDDDENLYVAQWNAGQTYPIKLIRV